MEQHPIPQNVSSYQFKLVGDMTLKQFFELAGGCLVGLIFYSSGLIGIIKWPFTIFSVLLGVAMAFVPLEERPLEKWIVSFFRTIYSPTIYNWKKTTTPVKYFQDEGTATEVSSPTTGKQDAALKNYLNTTKQPSGSLAKLEGVEESFLSRLSSLFTKGGTTPTQTTQTQTDTTTTEPAKPKKLEIPQSTSVKITPQTPHLVVEEKAQPVVQDLQVKSQKVSPAIAGEEIISTRQAVFSTDAAPPSPPTVGDVVVGQVVDENRKIIEGAIIEIKDEYGRPIRALRSNKLGHFIAVTPLEKGKYDIVTEKEGYQFTPVNFVAKGEIIPPILVQGRKLAFSSNQTAIDQPNTMPN